MEYLLLIFHLIIAISFVHCNSFYTPYFYSLGSYSMMIDFGKFTIVSRIYQIDIPSKQLEELSFSKNHEVFYITGNSNNEYLITVFKNGKIFAVGIKKQIFYFKNLQNQDKDNNNNNKVDNSFKIFCNDNLDKVVVYTSAQITVWYRSLTKTKITSSKEITELMGFHIYIQLKEERKVFLSQKDKLFNE